MQLTRNHDAEHQFILPRKYSHGKGIVTIKIVETGIPDGPKNQK